MKPLQLWALVTAAAVDSNLVMVEDLLLETSKLTQKLHHPGQPIQDQLPRVQLPERPGDSNLAAAGDSLLEAQLLLRLIQKLHLLQVLTLNRLQRVQFLDPPDSNLAVVGDSLLATLLLLKRNLCQPQS